MELTRIAAELRDSLRKLEFKAPVAYVYNPLSYAWSPHRRYLEGYGSAPKEVVLFGINPGPWGMAQTGVPFGEVNLVRDWLGIRGPVGKPQSEHPKRPIEGFDCPRSEVSGRRLWGWAKETFQTPERFFSRFLIVNYCPLLFLEASGRNRTPDKLPAAERAPLVALCDAALRRTVKYLSPRCVIGVGRFAERRAEEALSGLGVRTASILHPSPASPAANRGWARQATRQLEEIGVL